MELNWTHLPSLEDSIHGVRVDLGEYGMITHLRPFSGEEMEAVRVNRTRDGITNPYAQSPSPGEEESHDPGFRVWETHEIHRGRYIVHVHSQWAGLLRGEWVDLLARRQYSLEDPAIARLTNYLVPLSRAGGGTGAASMYDVDPNDISLV